MVARRPRTVGCRPNLGRADIVQVCASVHPAIDQALFSADGDDASDRLPQEAQHASPRRARRPPFLIMLKITEQKKLLARLLTATTSRAAMSVRTECAARAVRMYQQPRASVRHINAASGGIRHRASRVLSCEEPAMPDIFADPGSRRDGFGQLNHPVRSRVVGNGLPGGHPRPIVRVSAINHVGPASRSSRILPVTVTSV